MLRGRSADRIVWTWPLRSQGGGRKADGTYDHNYNWYDPEGKCPGTVPCFTGYRGTPSVGAVVSDAASTGEKMGVAPGATLAGMVPSLKVAPGGRPYMRLLGAPRLRRLRTGVGVLESLLTPRRRHQRQNTMNSTVAINA